MGNSAFTYSEFYDNIISLIDCICKALIDAYCCVVWTKPFLDHKSKAWLTGGVYAVIMLFLILYLGRLPCWPMYWVQQLYFL